MPLPIPDYATVIEPQGLAFLRNRFPGKDTHTESFLGKTARFVARMVSYLLVSVQSAVADAVPTQSTSLTQLQNMATNYGLPSNQGGFGPNGATAATGGIALITGTVGTVYLNGALLTAPDGVTVFQLSGGVTIPGGGSINGNINAVTLGSAGNLPAGTVLTWQAPPAGSDLTTTLTTGTGGAIDTEAKQPLLARVQGRFQTPPKGGAAPDYRTWAESIPGVFRAYIYPKREGTGTVDVLITAAGSGTGRKPSTTVQDTVDDYINGDASDNPPVIGVRPVAAVGTSILLPYVAGAGLAIRIRIIVSQSKYAFDWALGASTFTVASYSAGPPGVITMNQALPLSLTQQIDAYIASPTTVTAPRLQVMSAGLASPGIAVPVHAVNYNVGAKTLTLENPLPAGWVAPSTNDAVYPYGPAVAIVAQGAFATATPAVIGGVQAYIDSLGPSRAGGYGNPLDVWPDTASIFTLGEVAVDATDTDKTTKPVSRVLAVTLNGGTIDIQATDTLANGIQLLTCASIAITD